ncbi:MAG: PAS domain-containing protein [Cyanothece sp. SIO2G6]|nr:PAS domain-containing protein [Cyanothece sp. SIO2G6]
MAESTSTPTEADIDALHRRITELESELDAERRDHAQAQADLQASQAETRSLLQAIPDLIMRINLTGTYLDFIAAPKIELLTACFEERVGRSIYDILPHELAEKYMLALRQSLATEITQIFEYELTVHGVPGHYEARAVACGDDEAVFIVRDVTERHRIEAALALEREKSEKLLLNILPPPVAEQLKQGQRVATQFDEATILFADIVGFTQLSSQLSATDLVEVLNQLFSCFDALADRYHLEKIKTIGDAYMVVGGIPTARPDHAEAIADMALDMLQATQTFSQQCDYPLEIRIGINTGPVVAGVIGIKKFIYDLWGDAVNVASRMESLGIPGSIQITETTRQKLLNHYAITERGVIEVKGKGLMPTYLLLAKGPT